MKKILLLVFAFAFKITFSQTASHLCSEGKIAAFKSKQILNQKLASTTALASHEKGYTKHASVLSGHARKSRYAREALLRIEDHDATLNFPMSPPSHALSP